MISDRLRAKLRAAADLVEKRHKDSQILDSAAEERLPKFDGDEVGLTGKVLGRGGFCEVREVNQITLHQGTDDGDPGDIATRAYISGHILREKDYRYAIKKLSPAVVADSHRFIQGTVDLAVEASFLAVLNHPNIIKMRGMASCDPFSQDYFLILDRLYGTLEPKMVEWKKLHSKLNGPIMRARPSKRRAKLNEMWTDRFLVAYDLASAMRYMHSLNVLYRDLKPENIGFDVRGDVKIFDLGLAKELNPKLADADGLYKLTGNTGSLRYMAPEIAKNQPYNFAVDVYSFGIIFWQICSLAQPYAGYTCKMHAELVVGKGYRPKPSSEWPIGWVELCRALWSSKVKARPSFEGVCEMLAEEIEAIRGEGGSGHRALDISGKSNHSLHNEKLKF